MHEAGLVSGDDARLRSQYFPGIPVHDGIVILEDTECRWEGG